MQHVRIRQNNVSALPNCFSRITRSIAVVREHSETVVEPFRQILQFSQLILGKCFGWEQVQGASVGIFQDRIQDREVVAKRLAGCRRRHHNHVLAVAHQFSRRCLVRVELLDSLRAIGLSQGTCHPGWHRTKLGFSRRKLPYGGENFVAAIAGD